MLSGGQTLNADDMKRCQLQQDYARAREDAEHGDTYAKRCKTLQSKWHHLDTENVVRKTIRKQTAPSKRRSFTSSLTPCVPWFAYSQDDFQMSRFADFLNCNLSTTFLIISKLKPQIRKVFCGGPGQLGRFLGSFLVITVLDKNIYRS